MPQLPAQPSLEYLKKLAKERLRSMRESDPSARLADAQLLIAREYGFASWRALRSDVQRRVAPVIDEFMHACTEGDLAAMRRFLALDAALINARATSGATPLHVAVRHPDAVRLLVDHGADVNARDGGDHALPLHFAAGGAPVESVRALLDAGSDVHGHGDAHALDVIGWAACFAEPRRDVIALLLERGARHHVFSAVATGDHQALRDACAADPEAIRRRLSIHEQEQTALHYCVAPPDGLVGGLFRNGEHYATLALLIELGAEVDALDSKGRSALDIAMLRGDERAMQILARAGATLDMAQRPVRGRATGDLAASVRGLVPMIAVRSIDASLDWYRAIGFEVSGTNGAPGALDWAEVVMGEARIMFASSGDAWRDATRGITLWLYTDRIDDLYAALRDRQLERSRVLLRDGKVSMPEIRFRADLHTTFYGMREFAIEDPDGTDLTFAQPA